MALTSGTKLGPYEIQSPLGAGGMGEVYRARDTRLERTVAVKILPEQLSSSELRQRFDREARALSSLSHPHICHLYDVGSQDGIDYLVMEYLEGETLASRLAKGPLPIDQLLKVGMEIAEALETAHRQGVVHRDLKPGNVMLTKSGANLMDFGLVKTGAGEIGLAAEASQAPLTPSSPTRSMAGLTAKVSPLTQKGTILGTFQYMAPEVLQGAEADARSDLFSFGCVLYEMATGKAAFDGKTQLSVLAAILEKEPEPMSTLQPMTPPALEMVVKGCLEKDPNERVQTAHDLKMQLGLTKQASTTAKAALSKTKQNNWLSWAVAAVATLLAIAAGVAMWLRPATLPVVRATILPPDKTNFLAAGDTGGPAMLSPDGEKIAFVAKGPDSPQAIWVRGLNSQAAQRLEGTEGASFPFWSPDSRNIGYFANGKLNRIAATGGPSTSLADAASGRGGTWGKNDVIIYTPHFNVALMQVNAQGGAPRPATTVDPALHTTHRWPWFLPDGKHVLYLAANHGGGVREKSGIYFASLDGKENKLLVATDSQGEYASGYLVYRSQSDLMAQRFDPESGTLSGEAFPIADRVQFDDTVWRAEFSVSSNGMMLYQRGADASGTQLSWFDRSGKPAGTVGERGQYYDPRISPDGTKVVVGYGSPTEDIWVFDAARQLKTRLTFDAPSKLQPAWSPDGRMIAYVVSGSVGGGRFADSTIRVAPANGGGKPRLLLEEKGAQYSYPCWTPDGKTLLFVLNPLSALGTSIYSVPVEGGKPSLVVAPANPEARSINYFRISPNGRWIAYTSNESGKIEIYVTAANGQGGKWQVSPKGGAFPAWRGDGKELFFFDPTNILMAVDVNEKGSEFSMGQPQRLFQQQATANGAAFDVTPDGKRFLFNVGTPDLSAPLNLVVNWTAEVKK